MPTGISQNTIDAVKAAMEPRSSRRPQNVGIFLAMLQGTQQPIVDAGGQRRLIESLIAQKSYREAYDACLNCLTSGFDVEYAEKTSQQLVAIMRRRARWKDAWYTFVIALGAIASVIGYIIIMAIS